MFLLFHNGLNGRAPDYLSQKFTPRQPHTTKILDEKKKLLYRDTD